jgi:site-specific DNA recombinase
MTPMPALPRPNLASGHISAPCYLLTGLMRCGVCGGGYTKISANLFGCAAARNKGTCDNRLNIRTEVLEDIVLAGLKHRLMAPEIFKEFAAAFIAERNTIVAQQNAHFAAAKSELGRVKSRQKVYGLFVFILRIFAA